MADEYKAGDLLFSIETTAKSTDAVLDNLIKKLGTVSKTLADISSTAKSLSTATGLKNGKTGGGASYNESKTTSHTRFVNDLKKQYIETTRTGKELKKVNQTYNEQGDIIKTITTTIDEMGNKITQVSGKSGNKLFNSFKWTDLLNKVYFLRNYTAQMFQTVKGMLQNAIDYAETLNLWKVATQGYLEMAEEFVNKMNKAYGISTQTLMQYQAVFKNMVGSLGGLSDDVGYALSEYLTQMALDYASLYNVSIKRAMETFQSMLSGEVVPIRSVAGYDVTEITIYETYKRLGGEKTIRQLNQVEKRLLRIYATFEQMSASGAIGDLAKTIESSANQLRVFTEGLKEFTTWLGIVVERWLNPLLPYLNAVVITLTNITKALAIASGYEPDEYLPVEDIEQVNEGLDEMQGKLLGFDKFSALNTKEDSENVLGIDEKLLAGLSRYQSVLDNVSSQAQALADNWAKFWFVDGDYAKGFTDQAQLLLDVLSALGTTVAILLGYGLAKKVVLLTGKITGLTNAVSLLNFALIGGLVFSITRMVEAFKEGDYWGGILYQTLTGLLVAGFVRLHKELIKTISLKVAGWIGQITLNMVSLIGIISHKIAMLSKLQLALLKVGVATGSAIAGFMLFNSIINSFDGSARRVVSIISIVAGALATVLGVILAIKGALKGGLIGATIAGLGVGALVAGIKGVANQNSKMQTFKTGGLVEDGLFQMSKGELIGNFSDGTTVVANNQQIVEGIKQGVYTAVRSAMANSGNGGDIILKLDGKELARANVGNTATALSNKYNIDFKPR